MSYQEKQNYISLFTSLTVSIPYFIYVFSKYRGESFSNTEDELIFWTGAILLLIPLRIVVEIIANILAAILTAIITQEKENTITDERDELIRLKGSRNSFFIFILGFLGGISAMYFNKSVSDMFSIFLVSGFLAEMMEIASKTYYYKKGI